MSYLWLSLILAYSHDGSQLNCFSAVLWPSKGTPGSSLVSSRGWIGAPPKFVESGRAPRASVHGLGTKWHRIQLTRIPAEGPLEKVGSSDSIPVALDTIPVALDSVTSVFGTVPSVWSHGKEKFVRTPAFWIRPRRIGYGPVGLDTVPSVWISMDPTQQ